MADFFDILRPASYRGVEFVMTTSSSGLVPALVEHKPPGARYPIVEWLGEEHVFSVEGFVLGQGQIGDYFPERKRLVDALRDPDSGTLVHPYEGTRVVNVRRFTVRETYREGRKATFRIEFVETDPATSPLPVTRSIVPTADAAARATSTAADARALDSLDLSGPTGVVDAVAGELQKLGSKLRSADVFRGPASDAARLGRSVTRLITDAQELATSPARMVQEVGAALDSVIQAAGQALPGALSAYEAAAAVVADLIPGAQPNPSSINGAAQETANLIAARGLAGAVRVAVRMDWVTLDDALDVRRRLGGKLVDASGRMAGAVSAGLLELLGALSDGVPPTNRSIPRLGTWTPPKTLPAAVIAYRLGGAEADPDELVRRNRGHVRHPLFVRGGTPLEILVP